LEQEIHDAYVPKIYLHISPTVTPGNRYYTVSGQINQPGQSKQLYTGYTTLLRAIGAAGGFTDFAARKRVQLTGQDGKTYVIDCKKAQNKDTKLDIEVLPGDKIFVDQKTFWGSLLSESNRNRPVNAIRAFAGLLPWSSFKFSRAKRRARNSPPPVCRCKSAARPGRTCVWRSRESGPATSKSPGRGLIWSAKAQPDALLSINGVQTDRGVLRNGDIISVGALKIQFALSPVRQPGQRAREGLTWAALGLLCLAQVLLVYQLIR
jgi:hypothetical protein